MKYYSLFFLLFLCISAKAQDNISLEYFISQAKTHLPALQENKNLQKLEEIQTKIIKVQNSAFDINITSEILIAPYFNNNGKLIDITTNPSPEAYGYDVGITNGGLYSSQLNITKNLFNQSVIDNLLFQNKLKNKARLLSSEENIHNLNKNLVETYIMAYQLQLKEEINTKILSDLNKRLEVVELMVKKGILMESDYLLLQLDLEQKKLEIQQIQGNFNKTINELYTLAGIPAEEVKQLLEPDLNTVPNPNHFYYQRKFTNDSLQIIADKQVFENQYKPQLSAYGNTGLNAVEIPNIDHRFGVSAGVKLTIPIYDGHQKKYNEMKIELKQDSLNYFREYKKTEMQNNLKNIQEQMNSLNESKSSLETQLKKQENILEIYKGKLVQGQISIIDYLNVVQNYKMNVYTKLQMQTNSWLLQNQYNFTNW